MEQRKGRRRRNYIHRRKRTVSDRLCNGRQGSMREDKEIRDRRGSRLRPSISNSMVERERKEKRMERERQRKGMEETVDWSEKANEQLKRRMEKIRVKEGGVNEKWRNLVKTIRKNLKVKIRRKGGTKE